MHALAFAAMEREMEKEINVIISETALQQMCFSALEAYSAKKIGRKRGHDQYLETYGLIWGRYTNLKLTTLEQRFYYIDFLCIETSANQKKDEIERNEESLIIKRDLDVSYWPHTRFLGDFHTHPYEKMKANADKIKKNKLYEYSEQDYEDIEKNSLFWRNHRYRIGLVCTIVNLQRAARTDGRIDDSTIFFGFGNYKIWIKAYYAMYKSRKKIRLSTDLYLACPSLLGMVEYNSFGRHVKGEHVHGDI